MRCKYFIIFLGLDNSLLELKTKHQDNDGKITRSERLGMSWSLSFLCWSKTLKQ